MLAIDPVVVARGAVVGVMAVAAATVGATVAGAAGALSATAFLVWSALAFGLAGLEAGRRRLDTPVIHGMAAGAAAAVVVMAGTALVRANTGDANDDGVTAAVMATITVIAAASGAGALGGLGADWLHRRRRRTAPAD